ncbi:hypothetical protein VNO78_10137 [Psophocarpus tetragonolobus]|uniref:Uncharacterized protein n=1 Tax=Psophocarpus tetragonolobus TaxID=3891 RepID=A0AAN9XLZ8_PSOTE
MSMNQKKATEVKRKRGGYRTVPCIIANESFEKVAVVGLRVNMILYLLQEYRFDPATAAIVIFLWNALTNFLPIICAFLSDSWLGRFRVIAWGTIIHLVGLVVLWLTAIVKHARPPQCDIEPCANATALQLLILFSSLVLMALGAGGIRSCTLAFTADQINNLENPQNERTMKSFFNWYYVSVGISITVSMVFIVYIQVKAGWIVGFGISLGIVSLSAIMFFGGSSIYIKVKPNKSLLTGFAQVIVAAWKNRHLPLPPKNSDIWYFHKSSILVQPTNKVSFLNKACIMKNKEKDVDIDGIPIDPWSVCTVRQVEELKAIIKVLPIWSTGIILAATISQQSFSVVQASTMDRKVFNIDVPPTSFTLFIILTLTMWVLVYNRIIVPLFPKDRILKVKQRTGIGLMISCLATVMATLVEKKRRNEALNEGFIDNPKGVVNMSAMWLVPQYCLHGLAQGLNFIGQIEFYYSQFPKTMSSVAVSISTLSLGVGNLVGSLIVKVVKDGTRKGGRPGWLASNINRGHYDYYYGLLFILNLVNLLCFLILSWAYGSTHDIKNWDENVDKISTSEKEIISTT